MHEHENTAGNNWGAFLGILVVMVLLVGGAVTTVLDEYGERKSQATLQEQIVNLNNETEDLEDDIKTIDQESEKQP